MPRGRRIQEFLGLSMSSTDLAYLAGIIDGEGSITLANQAGRGRSVLITLRIGNTNTSLFDWIEKKVPGALVRTMYKSDGNKICFYVNWTADNAIEIVCAVYPYLVLKKEQAKIAMGLHAINKLAEAERGLFNRQNPVPDWLIDKRMECYNKMRVLNQRGGMCHFVN